MLPGSVILCLSHMVFTVKQFINNSWIIAPRFKRSVGPTVFVINSANNSNVHMFKSFRVKNPGTNCSSIQKTRDQMCRGLIF